MFPPKARVLVSPLIGGATAKGQVVAQVNDAGAYLVRLSSGRRIVVAESQLETREDTPT